MGGGLGRGVLFSANLSSSYNSHIINIMYIFGDAVAQLAKATG
jgi:hypothetical protein